MTAADHVTPASGPTDPRDPSRVWARRPEVLWRSIPGLVVLARPELDAGDPVTVTGPGAAIWEILEPPISEAELVELLIEVFDAEADVVAADVHALLCDLEDRALVRRLAPDAAAQDP